MTHLLVSNEGDIEHGIEYATNIAMEQGHETTIEFSFTSKELMQIFAKNLFQLWVTKRVPQENYFDPEQDYIYVDIDGDGIIIDKGGVLDDDDEDTV